MPEGQPEGDTPGLIARPPLVYFCSILIGLSLDALWPVAMLPAAWSLRLGGPLILIACVLFAVSVRELRRVDTHRPQPTPGLECAMRPNPECPPRRIRFRLI